jgi:hypothetical protein
MIAAERLSARAEILLQSKNVVAAVVLAAASGTDGELQRLRKIRALEGILEAVMFYAMGVIELIEAENAADGIDPLPPAPAALPLCEDERTLRLVVDNEKGPTR